MKIIFASLLFSVSISFAQTGDFILLKKKNKTIQSFYPGSDIEFTSTRGTFVHAQINRIYHDTLFLQEFLIRKLPTTLGTYIIDTAGSYHYKYDYREIAAFGRKEKTNFNVHGSGAALLGGGVLLTLGSGVVYLADRDKFSAPLLLAAVGLGTIGYIMSHPKNKGIVIGKKYRLVYMDMQDKKR